MILLNYKSRLRCRDDSLSIRSRHSLQATVAMYKVQKNTNYLLFSIYNQC